MTRNFSIDLLRFIAAFFIMTLHTELPSFGIEMGSIVRVTARWAVPFFFITTGYYLGLKLDSNQSFSFTKIEKNVSKLISIFLISSSVYLIHSFIFSYTVILNNVSFLLHGTRFHLWFIGSMIFGYLVIWYFYNTNLQRLLPSISILIVAFAVLCDSYDFVLGSDIIYNQIPRFLTAIPFMYLGIYIAGRKPSKHSAQMWFFIFLIGLALQLTEVYVLNKLLNYPTYEHQMLIGTVISSIAIFMFCITFKAKKSLFSEYGKNYSLFIYLYHVLAYWAFMLVFQKASLWENDVIKICMPLFGFIFMIFVSVVMDKFTPKLFAVLNGDLSPLTSRKSIRTN